MDELDNKIKLFEQNRMVLLDSEILDSASVTWTELKEATMFVHDTLDLCKASAKENFGEGVMPEIVIAIYDRVMQQVAAVKGAES